MHEHPHKYLKHQYVNIHVGSACKLYTYIVTCICHNDGNCNI